MLFFDGMRVAMEMADLSYGRLAASLRELALNEQLTEASEGAAKIAATNDAWNFIDSVNRLRVLADRCPGLQKGSTLYKRFSHAIAGIKDLRNFAQHLNTGVSELALVDLPVWGTLNWITVVDASTNLVRWSTIVLGSLFASSHPVVSLAGRTSFRELEAITLRAGGHSVVLSDIPHAMELLLRSVEEGLRQTTVGAHTLRSDFLVKADVRLGVPESERSAEGLLHSHVMASDRSAHFEVDAEMEHDAIIEIRLTPVLPADG
jgi:hypothetical protein